MTRIVYQLVGYDPETDLASTEVDIPQHELDLVKRVAKVSFFDEQAIGAYPLTRDQVSYIAGLIGKTVDADRFDYFFQGHAEPHRRRA